MGCFDSATDCKDGRGQLIHTEWKPAEKKQIATDDPRLKGNLEHTWELRFHFFCSSALSFNRRAQGL